MCILGEPLQETLTAEHVQVNPTPLQTSLPAASMPFMCVQVNGLLSSFHKTNTAWLSQCWNSQIV